MAGDWHSLYRDPQWQKKRLEILERAGWCCENCGDSESELQVHHGYYDKDKKPWEYELRSLHALCDFCHEDAEDIRRAIKQAGGLPLSIQRQIALLIDALLYEHNQAMIEQHGKRIDDLTSVVLNQAAKSLQGGNGGRRLD